MAVDDPRERFKKQVLDALAAARFSDEYLAVVKKTLDDHTTDDMFRRASAIAQISGIRSPSAVRITTEYYYDDSAKTFASRENPQSNIQVNDSVVGSIAGRDARVGQVTQSVLLGAADQIL